MATFSLSPRIGHALAALLLVVHAVLAVASMVGKSPTVDEYTYISTGYLYWQTGDLRLDRTHPPGIRWLIGLPLQATDVSMPPLQKERWGTDESYFLGYPLGWEMLLREPNDWATLLLLARLPIVLLSVGTGLLVYIWGLQLYGSRGALISLTLVAFCPTLLAHARLATLDTGTVFFMMLSLYMLYRYVRMPGWSTLMLAAGVYGLTLSTKVIALLWLPLAVCTIVWANRRGTRVDNQRLIRHLGVFLVLSVATLCLTYGFPLKPVYYLDTLSNVVSKSLQDSGGTLQPGMPHRNHAFYLLGSYSLDGFPHYYLVALAVKIPLAAWVLIGLAVARVHPRFRLPADALLLGGIGLIVAASLFNRVNIGIRHVLPVLPLLYLYAGRVGETCTKRWPTAVTGLAMLWFVASGLLVFPHYIPYFNELASGPTGGHRVLDDSNLDWGQDLGQLGQLNRRYPDETLYVATGYAFDAQAFGVEARPFSPEMIAHPPAGVVAVSKQWALRNRVRRTGTYFDWIERYRPAGHIGHSIWVYRFDEAGNPLPPE